MTNYLKEQALLKKQAGNILKDLNLLPELNKYGEVNFVGSYALDLIVKKDIDIVVSTSVNYKDFLKLVDYLFPLTNIYNLTLWDFRKSIHPERPQGIYCGISYLIKPDTFWKIDIWFMPKEGNGAKQLVDWVKKRLTNDNREIILKIKNEMLNTKHGKEISGMDVYKAVLEKNVKNLDGFRDYLKQQGREL